MLWEISVPCTVPWKAEGGRGEVERTNTVAAAVVLVLDEAAVAVEVTVLGRVTVVERIRC